MMNPRSNRVVVVFLVVVVFVVFHLHDEVAILWEYAGASRSTTTTSSIIANVQVVQMTNSTASVVAGANANLATDVDNEKKTTVATPTTTATTTKTTTLKSTLTTSTSLLNSSSIGSTNTNKSANMTVERVEPTSQHQQQPPPNLKTESSTRSLPQPHRPKPPMSRPTPTLTVPTSPQPTTVPPPPAAAAAAAAAASTQPGVVLQVPLTISYRGVSGLGHRLGRQSNAWHFAKQVQATSLTVDWGWCQTPKPAIITPAEELHNTTWHYEIFSHLFGNKSLSIPYTHESAQVSFPYVEKIQWNQTKLTDNENTTTKTAVVVAFDFVNDVPYYTHRQINVMKMNRQRPQFYGKDQSDEEHYQLLRNRFRFMDRVQSIQQQHDFANHTVLGLHLRLGNGEKGDFMAKNRGMATSMGSKQWLFNLGHLIVEFCKTQLDPNTVANQPPLVFVSTDSSEPEKLVQELKVGLETAAAAVNFKNSSIFPPIPVVTVPQPRVPSGKGVSYGYEFGTKEKCIEGWISQFVDMVLLAESNVVLAGQYSSFTQTMPLSHQLFNKNKKGQGRICNVGASATVMECFDDYASWFTQGKGGIEASRVPSDRVVVGDLNGTLQHFDHTVMMPMHTYSLRKMLDRKLKDLPAKIIEST